MAYQGKQTRRRRKKQKRHSGRRVLCLLLLVLLAFAGLITKTYMQKTGADFATAVREELHMLCQQISNILPGKKSPVPINPYSEEDYYQQDGYIMCSTSEVSRVGVDVSDHQGPIDWGKVRAAGVEFAMIRTGYRGYTDGTINADVNYFVNMDAAQAAGLDLGVYFFSQATTVEEAREEAQFVLKRLGGYDVAYPVIFDWESAPGRRTEAIDGKTMTECALAFCDTLEAFGYEAGVYFNQSVGYNGFDLKALSDYEFWLAEYRSVPEFLYEVQIWQYACDGHVDGIATAVDLNLCYRDYHLREEVQ